jgi:hypothetical protein
LAAGEHKAHEIAMGSNKGLAAFDVSPVFTHGHRPLRCGFAVLGNGAAQQREDLLRHRIGNQVLGRAIIEAIIHALTFHAGCVAAVYGAICSVSPQFG